MNASHYERLLIELRQKLMNFDSTFLRQAMVPMINRNGSMKEREPLQI